MTPRFFKKSISRWLLLLLVPVAPAGCKKDWLNEKTNKNLAVPSTLSDFQQLMDNADVINGNSCGIGEIGSDGHTVIPLYWQYESGQEQNAYTWSHDKPNMNAVDWDAPYSRVAYCNVVLEGLQRIVPGNSSDRQTWNAIEGNALFQRARSFYELAQVYAPPYTSSPAPGSWGIPLRLSSDINVPSARSTLAGTYSRVINDLLLAKDLLPLSVPYKTRASRPAALAMLARVYLGMEDYNNAYLYADSCLQLYHTLLDYNSLPYAATGYLLPQFNNEVLFHATLVNWGDITKDDMVDTSLYAMYDSEDLRRSFFFKPGATGMLFRGSYNGSVIPFSGLAVDEMYLVRAECNARSGQITPAMNDLDTLLIKRISNGGAFRPVTAASEQDALTKVLQERRKELLFRGLRWTDLRRLNHDPVFALTINRVVNGSPYTLSPNSFRYTFPIPDDIIQISGMAQNPGW